MSEHLWALSKLLVMNFSTDDGPKRNATLISDHLLPYVIATSYKKMSRRLTNKHASLPYIQSLSAIDTFPFEAPNHGPLSVEEIHYDGLFLLEYVVPVAPKTSLQIPNIIKQAELAQARQSFELYNQDTCVEFHQLFVRILSLFTQNLERLVNIRKMIDKGEISVVSTKELVQLVKLLGLALQRLSKGGAFTMHMKNIEAMLWRHSPGSISMPTPDFGKEKNDEPKGGEEREDVEEQNNKEQDDDEDRREASDVLCTTLTAEGVTKPLWLCYVDWLRLMVSHFNAVDTLIDFVVGPSFVHKTISFQLVVPPPVDKQLFPWRDLFNHPELFPTETRWDPQFTATSVGRYADTTNACLLNFLDQGLADSHRARQALKEWKQPGKKENIIRELERLGASKIPGWGEEAKDMLVQLKECSGVPADLVKKISMEIQWLCSLFTSLESKNGFGGTLHCEAILASLLRGNSMAGEDAMKQVEVCCIFNVFCVLVLGVS
jgi:hypothetical protein